MGLLAALVYFVGTVYWTSEVVAHVRRAVDAVCPAGDAAAGGLPGALPGDHRGDHWRGSSRAAECAALFFAPGAWVATEFFRGYLFGGFPWVPLGNSQVTVLPVAQLASLLGVYGLSALVAFVNAAIAVRAC